MAEKTPQQSIAEKVRQHFQNQHEWRQRAVELDSSDSSGEFDLSKSFKEILIAKQAEIALRHTDKKIPTETTASYADDSIDQIVQSGGDQYEVVERCSPVKMVGLMRPSTVYEEDSDTSCVHDVSGCNAEREIATSFETAHTCATRYNAFAVEFYRQCDGVKTAVDDSATGTTTTTATTIKDTRLANESVTDPLTTNDLLYELAANRHTPLIKENTSSKSGDLNVPWPSAEYSKDSLMDSLSQSGDASASKAASITGVVSPDSLIESKSQHRQFDDTLEMVEYVPDASDSKYLLKPIQKSSLPSSPLGGNVVDVIEIDSSPDTSYITAHTHLPSSVSQEPQNDNEPQLCTFPSKKSRTFYDNDFDELCTSLTSASMKAAANQTSEEVGSCDDQDVINLSCSSSEEEQSKDAPHRPACSTNRVTTNTLDDVSSFMTDSTAFSDNGGIPDEFNDSLERAEYMMEQGRLILAKQKLATSTAAAIATESPFRSSVQVPLQPRTTNEIFKTPSSAILRPHNTNSPKLKESPLFKKPPAHFENNITPGVTKKPPAKCRIPKPLSASKKPLSASKQPLSASKMSKFKNIKSPIGIYIKNRPPTEMEANVKPLHNFFDSSYCARASKELNFTVVETPAQDVKKETSCAIPRKAYVCAESNLFKDVRCVKVPGGDKVHKMLGIEPEVVQHIGRIGGASHNHAGLADDTFDDFSLLPGDVSVQVVHDLKRA